MKAKTIIYKRVFALGDYQNETISIELEVEEGESAKEVLAKAKKFVESQHADRYESQTREHYEKQLQEAKDYLDSHKEDEYLPF